MGTLRSTLEAVLKRFPIRRVIAVADRGLMSTENLEQLREMTLPGGKPFEFILAVPGRWYGEFIETLQSMHDEQCRDATAGVIVEHSWNGLRLIVAHDPNKAAEQTARRTAQIADLEAQARGWAAKLDGQDSGHRSRGRKLSDSGARAQMYHGVVEARLAKIIRVDMKSDLFSYEIDEKAHRRAELLDGKLFLVTNTSALAAKDIVAHYKSLADIERGFRVLKSEIEIGPGYHRLPNRIQAHASLCFIALILHRIMRMRLDAAEMGLSPERALDTLQRIQHHRIELDGKEHSGITALTDEQCAILNSLDVSKPGRSESLTLL